MVNGCARRLSRSARLGLPLLLLGMLSGQASAAGKSREQREAQARLACDAGRVEEGVELLAALFHELRHTNYVYNQARCYQQNGRAEQSISRFREYLRVTPEATPETRARVERFIEELQQDHPQRGPAATTPLAATPPPPQVLDQTPRSLAPAPRSRGLTISAIALGGVGLLGIAGGVVSGLQVRALEHDVQNARPGQFDVDQLADEREKAHRYQTLQWVGYGVGGAALTAAAVCLLLRDNDGDRTNESALSLRITTMTRGGASSPSQASLTLAGRF